VGDTALLGPADVRALAERLGIRPTKTLGQNFVIDANTVRRIVRTADVTPDDVVIEVGPGLGSLTLALLPQVRRVVAVEIDPVLADALPATVAARAADLSGRLEVVRADALRVRASGHGDGAGLPGPEPTALVANLPYNVAVPVVLHLLTEFPSLRRALVMVQAEVADRMTAAPGSKIYGVPSVKLAWFGEARRAGPVGRAVFWPVPNVDSGLVAFARHDPPPTTATRREVFAVIDAAFAQRRKTLRAALAGWAGGPAEAERALRAAGVDPRARGEALNVAAFARIAEYGPGGAQAPEDAGCGAPPLPGGRGGPVPHNDPSPRGQPDRNEAEDHVEGAFAGDAGTGARDGSGRDGGRGRVQ
jgi:16S rRNA (adenine1518-N6/adenine1519-N6)-dimethyltransferase